MHVYDPLLVSKIRRAFKKAGKEASEQEKAAFLDQLLELKVPVLQRSSGRIAKILTGAKPVESLLESAARPARRSSSLPPVVRKIRRSFRERFEVYWAMQEDHLSKNFTADELPKLLKMFEACLIDYFRKRKDAEAYRPGQSKQIIQESYDRKTNT